eukprot:scaffold4301_cov115-Isochrysis_galbana.AAC.4
MFFDYHIVIKLVNTSDRLSWARSLTGLFMLGFPIVHPSRAPRGDGLLHHHPAHRRIPGPPAVARKRDPRDLLLDAC